MYVFGEIDRSTTIIESNLSNYSQNLTTASVGIQTIQIASGSNNNKYWQSLNVLFYTSGSSTYGSERKFAALSKNVKSRFHNPRDIDQSIGRKKPSDKRREQKALKKVINHAKKQYRKHYTKPKAIKLSGNMVEIDISKEGQ